MSDDSRAEKNSLHSVWPEARQFLCHFHMAQAEWRWLHNAKNGITLSDRSTLMRMFQKVNFLIKSKNLKLEYNVIVRPVFSNLFYSTPPLSFFENLTPPLQSLTER